MYSNETVVEIIQYIDQNITKKISIEELANRFHFNKDYIMRLFKKEIHMTITNYINKKRIYLSLNSLQNTENSILKIALENGFLSQEYYSETFSKILKVSPATYRKYTRRISNITDYEYDTIIEKMNDLQYEMKYVEHYKTHTFQEKKKRLSLFG